MKTFFAKLWAVIYKQVFVNWKSTVGGLVALLLGWFYFDGVISADIVGMIILIMGALGIVVSDPRSKKK